MKPAVRRSWVNWSLILLASVAVCAVLLTERLWTSAERAERAEHLVVGFRSDRVQTIRVTTQGKQVVIQRGAPVATDGANDDGREPLVDEARWVLVEPHQGEAEEASVDALLRSIQHAPFIRKVEEPALDRRSAGLDSPSASIELSMDSVRTRIHVGAPSPSPPKSRYVEVGGEGTANKGVYVVSESTANELSVSPDAFRVKQVVPFGMTTLERVVMSEMDGSSVTLLDVDGSWRLQTASGQPRLDPDAVQRLFAAFARSRAEVFLPDAPAPPVALEGGSPIQVVLMPKSDSSRPLTVHFGGPCPVSSTLELAVTQSNPPLRACTAALHLGSFVRTLPDLVDRDLFGVATADGVEEVHVRGGDEQLELARRGEVWTMRRPRAGEVEREVGEAFVQELLSVRGELGKPPLQQLKPIAEVTVLQPHVGSGRQPRETIRVLGEERPNAPLWVHREQDDVWLSISDKYRRLFLPSPLLLESTRLLSLELERIGPVTLSATEWAQRFVYEGRGAGCQLLSPPGYDADSALCLDVLDELRLLRARRWITERDDGTFGLEQPVLRVTFETTSTGEQQGQPSTPTERTLTVGAMNAEGDYFAQLSPGAAVFTLSRPTVETLSTLVVDRSPFLVEEQHVESITVVRGGSDSGRATTLRRLGSDLLEVPADGSQGVGVRSERRAAELSDAVSMVRPEAAIALLTRGAPEVAPKQFGFRDPTLEVSVAVNQGDQRQVFRWIVGYGDVYRNTAVYYAMVVTSKPSAVFVLPREAVQRILAAL